MSKFILAGVFLILLGFTILSGCGKKNAQSAISNQPTTTTVYLSWNNNPDTSIIGYTVYFGNTLDIDSMLLMFSTSSTEAIFDWKTELDSSPIVCFRLKAYNIDGIGPYTDGVCANVIEGMQVKLEDSFGCGDGLAAEDLSGQCRNKPTATMGALEAIS